LKPEDFEGRPSFVQRHRRTTRVILALSLGVGIAGLATCALVQRYHRGPASLEAAGVQVYVVENEERAPRRLGVVAARGDVVLVSETLRVVIAGGEREDAPLGAVLEASLANGEGLTRGATLTPVVTDGTTNYPVEFESFRLVERGPEGQRLAMRLEGKATVGRTEVRVFLEYRLSDDRHALMIATQLVSEDEVELSAGLVVRWGGHTPFVPGHGLVVSSLVTAAPVIGADMRAADGITGAAVFAQGQNVVIQVETEQHGDSVELDQTLVSVAPRALVPDAPQRQGFGLALSSYGFSDAVRRVGWLEGRHFPEASVVVPGAPTGTHVRLERRSGPVLLDAYVDARGVATLPLLGDLAVGDAFVVRAEAYGYLPSATREVVAGERVRLIIPKGGQVWVRLGDLSGTPMPARIRILGREGTATPALGPDYFASGAGEAVVTATGEAVIPLPPGAYRVIVSHGPEWSVAVSDVVVTEGTRPEIDARIEHVVPPHGWVACDFHVHQSPSDDSEVPIEDRVATLAAEGIGFAVPTDHNHVTDYAPAIVAHSLPDFGTVIGVEVTTWDPNFGHFNAFPFPLNEALPRNGAPVFRQRTPAELFAELHALGPDVMVQVNHPRLEPNIGYWDLTGFDAATGQAAGGPGGTYDAGYDLLEVWNGYDLSRPTFVERVFQEWLALLETGVRVVGTGNSDSHLVRYYWAGYPRTYVYAPDGARDPATILTALRAGAGLRDQRPVPRGEHRGQAAGGPRGGPGRRGAGGRRRARPRLHRRGGAAGLRGAHAGHHAPHSARGAHDAVRDGRSRRSAAHRALPGPAARAGGARRAAGGARALGHAHGRLLGPPSGHPHGLHQPHLRGRGRRRLAALVPRHRRGRAAARPRWLHRQRRHARRAGLRRRRGSAVGSRRWRATRATCSACRSGCPERPAALARRSLPARARAAGGTGARRTARRPRRPPAGRPRWCAGARRRAAESSLRTWP
jgi:hypothetical protein